MELPSLTELANTYGSDKGTLGPSDAWGGLNYTDVYAAYLEPLRNQPLRILEIGIGATGERWDARIVHGRNTGGASIKMWHDYFEAATIIAIDINPANYLDNDRITTHVIDQSDASELTRFIQSQPPFDLIIDDGSHHPEHQQLSLSLLFPHLSPGGWYIIEDLDDNGRGDTQSDERTYCPDVYNTRKVLKSFLASGEAKKPNGFASEDFLTSVQSIAFHCPEPVVHSHWQLIPPRRKFTFQYKADSERLAMIRKQATL